MDATGWMIGDRTARSAGKIARGLRCSMEELTEPGELEEIRKTENYFANKKNKDCGTPIMKEW